MKRVQTKLNISVHSVMLLMNHAAFIALNDSRVNNWEASGNSLCAGRNNINSGMQRDFTSF